MKDPSDMKPLSSVAPSRLLMVVGFLAISGCLVVRSYYPFCTPQAEVKCPALHGVWGVAAEYDLLGREWFPGETILWTFSDKSALVEQSGEYIGYDITVFEVGNEKYVDCFPAHRGRRSMERRLSTVDAHSLYRFRFEGDELVIYAANPERVKQLSDEGRVKIPALHRKGNLMDGPLFIAQPELWLEFLSLHAADTALFKPTHRLVRQ